MSGIRHEEIVDRTPVSHSVAGFLAAVAIFGGLVSLFWYPGRTGPSSIFIALVAAGIGHPNRRFLGIAMFVASFGWLAGMIVAVFLDRPLF
jgi:hypothetical protein